MISNGLAQFVSYIYQCCAIIFRFAIQGGSLPFFRKTEYAIG
ncbi:hypothetical protein JOD43_000704 [Pullulanibacillus pueri]|nr:RAxF-45 family protein [Pullulanibacillus pueri]MBM7680542.1 hypothetical protein [Pullulanibacillus pueri]